MSTEKVKAKATPKRKRPLTPKQQRFVDELLADEDMRGTVAYQRAFRCSQRVAEVNASRLLRSARVQEEIAIAIEARAKRINITHDDVLRRLFAMMTADTNDIVQWRHSSCRHCYGKGHAFQWRDKEEYQLAISAEQRAAKEEERPPREISDAGGFGYDESLMPNEDCPKCKGDGHGHFHLNDTRMLRGGARLMYQGLEQTKEGIKPKLVDKANIIDKVMRHLGMFNDKLTLKGDIENPLELLVQQLPGAIIKPTSQDDDEGAD